ncbi:MAG: glycosyltransferase family 39 protein [Patescibacteria group bacterium]|nr:glycosyltransferase family 39 protein [Patescibacteria group bacterium]MDE2590976.1 glycosyltransferase family 39 protein [Patescibacteria group bacterium]
MHFLKKYRVELLIGAALLAVYFFLRTFHLLNLPVFTDEAIYMRWAQIAKQDAAERFISLSDGKQPLYVWVVMMLMRFVHDPLLAGRLVSVGSGALTATGLFFLTNELFKNRKLALLSAAIYVIFPFGLVYDRMAMYDSMVATFIIWGIYVEVLLVRKIRLDLAFIAALVIGAGMLVKTNTFFNLYFLPLTGVLFDFKQKHVKQQFFRWVVYIGITAVLANVYYSVLRLSPLYGIINEKNHTFIYSIHDWLQHPIEFFYGNLYGLMDWFFTYFGWLPAALVVVALIVFRKYWKEKLVLLIWFVPPLLGLALFGKVLYPRYILPMVVSLLPLVALSLWYLFTRFNALWARILIIILFATMYLRADFYILIDFAHAPIPKPDLVQYMNSWPAGGGIRESVAFFQQEAQKGPIFIATEGTFGLMPFSLQLYLQDKPNIMLQGFWPIGDTPPLDVVNASKKYPTYFVFYQPCPDCSGIHNEEAPLSWHLEKVAQYRKGTGTDVLTVYRILSPYEK